jgi:hypothetical protein
MARYAKFFSVGGGAGPNGLQLPLGTVLDATLRQVQDGLGTNSPLYLSTGSVRIGTTAASAMYWDNTNSRLGIGTSAPSAPLEIRGITNSSIVLRVGGLTPGRDFIFNPYYATNTYGGFFSNESGNITLGASLGTDNGSGIGIILGAPAGTRTALLHLKGTGSTSATTSLLVQNSSAVDLLKLQDNGVLTLGTVASGLGKIVVTTDPSFGIKSVMENSSGGQIIRQVSTDVIWFGGQTQTGIFANNLMNLVAPYITGNNPTGNTTASSFNFRVTGSPYGQTPSTASRGVLFDGQLAFQSGGYANYFELSPTYTFDVSNNRIVKGIYYNPTLVTPNTNDRHIAIETVSGDVLLATTSGQVGIGSTYGGWKLNVDGYIRAQRLDLTGLAAGGHVMMKVDDNGTVLRNSTFNINSGNGNAGQNANLAVGNTDTTVARLYVKGSGSTSATTSLLVQNSAGTQALKIADDLGFQIGSLAGAGQGLSIRTDTGGGGGALNSGINTNFNNGATWNDDTNVCALKIAYNGGIRIANTTRYPLTLGSDTKAVASAQLEMVSTTQGFLPPRMTTAQKNAIATPASGLMVYDTDLVRPCFFNGATWITL